MAGSSASASTSTTLLDKQQCVFREWMTLQEHELSELLQAQAAEQNCCDKDVLFGQLVEKNVQQFEAYALERTCLAKDHVSPFFAPSWCSSFEASLLWMAGCRPSLFIRLIYAISGMEFEAQISEFLEGTRTIDMSELSISARQLSMIDQLQGRTIKEEEKLTQEKASLEEKIGDHPLAAIAKKTSGVLRQSCLQNKQANEAINDHSRSMVTVLEEADKLRITTLKELLNILSPVQAVDFLIAAKKLHICIHEWGKKRDLEHGKFENA